MFSTTGSIDYCSLGIYVFGVSDFCQANHVPNNTYRRTNIKNGAITDKSEHTRCPPGV